jgi:hypothetical protein
VTKWNVDAAGVRQRYQGRNKQQKDIDLFDSAITQTLEQLHANGVDALSLDTETFEYARKTQEYLFVDFYASWYVPAQRCSGRRGKWYFFLSFFLLSLLSLLDT